MIRRILAQKLIELLEEKIQLQLNLRESLILGVVLKGLPVAYSLVKMNDAIENFVPIIAQRDFYMQHHVESYFPSLEWKNYFDKQLHLSKSLLIVDDVVNSGFTREKLESIVYSLCQQQKIMLPQKFGALVLNRKNLANTDFVRPNDSYALEVKAANVECDWGQITVPLWDLPIEAALQRCEQYHEKYWQNEKRWITITY